MLKTTALEVPLEAYCPESRAYLLIPILVRDHVSNNQWMMCFEILKNDLVNFIINSFFFVLTIRGQYINRKRGTLTQTLQ